MGPQRSGRKTARDLVADYLREHIHSGNFEPGHKLNVSVVADELGVSHTPTREAFQLLDSEGLVQVDAYRGARVSELSADEYQEIFLMRLGLEELAARLGAENITDSEVEAARQELSAMKDAAKRDDIDAFVRHDQEFHRIHYSSSGRRRLGERILSLRSAAERYIRLGYRTPNVDFDDVLESHARLLQTMEERNGEMSEKIISEDLSRTYAAVYERLKHHE